MDAFGIFEGGGAKGLAHIGALKAAEEDRVNFVGVGGTSAGAIVAALVAAGYTADELFLPDAKDSLFNRNFVGFFDPDEWANFNAIREKLRVAFADCKKPYQFWWALNTFLVGNRKRLSRLSSNGGLLSTH